MNTLVWLRYDLRLIDNESLINATKHSNCYVAFIYDETLFDLGSASKLWLNKALKDMNNRLNKKLFIKKGSFKILIPQLIKQLNINKLFYEKTYLPSLDKIDNEIAKIIKDFKCEVEPSLNRTLWDLSRIKKNDQSPYKVFTPFFKNGCLKQQKPQLPFELKVYNFKLIDDSEQIDDILPVSNYKWANDLLKKWDITELGGIRQLEAFLKNKLLNYKKGRDYPELNSISKLSPYIHFGQVSVRQIYHQLMKCKDSENKSHFLSELGWREFSYYLLYHFPKIEKENFQTKFDNFPWQFKENLFGAWTKGKTGYPIVDAGMRELYETGFMHNRLRMICGSFLVKNLLMHWSYGKKWFWDCLFDADQASNTASWQWVAGSGADAAPYFRIFNPMLQGKKFDPNGTYIKKYVPELKELPIKYLNEPWEAPKHILSKANIILGKDYPYPIVDYKQSREQALKAYDQVKK